MNQGSERKECECELRPTEKLAIEVRLQIPTATYGGRVQAKERLANGTAYNLRSEAYSALFSYCCLNRKEVSCTQLFSTAVLERRTNFDQQTFE